MYVSATRRIKGKYIANSGMVFMRHKREFIGSKVEKNHILNFIKIEDVPETNREKFIKTVEWFSLTQVEKAS